MKTSQEDKRQTSEAKSEQDSANVNVTLQDRELLVEALAEKTFPCPVCGIGLSIRFTRKQKPYCVCDVCGIQLFIRGKTGIRRLQKLIESAALIAAQGTDVSRAVALYNEIQHLRVHRKELEERQGLIFRDEDLDNAILAVDNEIERVQGELHNFVHDASTRRAK